MFTGYDTPRAPYWRSYDHRFISWCILRYTWAYVLRDGIYAPLHVINWPYLDIVSALTVGGHLRSLVRRCLTLCLMIYEILQSAHRPSDSRWILIFSLPISTFSALGVSHVMRSINVRYLLFFTYLYTYWPCMALIQDCTDLQADSYRMRFVDVNCAWRMSKMTTILAVVLSDVIVNQAIVVYTGCPLVMEVTELVRLFSRPGKLWKIT